MIAEETGLEPELIERILVILGTPQGRQRNLSAEDAAALRHCARVLAAGLPLVAFLQLVRVYVQSMRRIADAEVRLFHLYVHEPLIRDARAGAGDGRARWATWPPTSCRWRRR